MVTEIINFPVWVFQISGCCPSDVPSVHGEAGCCWPRGCSTNNCTHPVGIILTTVRSQSVPIISLHFKGNVRLSSQVLPPPWWHPSKMENCYSEYLAPFHLKRVKYPWLPCTLWLWLHYIWQSRGTSWWQLGWSWAFPAPEAKERK